MSVSPEPNQGSGNDPSGGRFNPDHGPQERPAPLPVRRSEGTSALDARIRSVAIADLSRAYERALTELSPQVRDIEPFRCWSPTPGHFLFNKFIHETAQICSQKTTGDAFSAIMLIRNTELKDIRCAATSGDLMVLGKVRAGLELLFPQPNPGLLRKELGVQPASSLAGKLDISPEELEHALLVAARHKVLSGVKDEFSKILRILEALPPEDLLQRERGVAGARFVAPQPHTEPASVVPAELLHVVQGALPFQPPADPSPAEKATLVVNYLATLTLTHTQNAHLSSDALDALRAKIEAALIHRPAQPLQFSIYTSLEKFAFPLDTRSSDIDPSELRVAIELRNLIQAVERCTGIAPLIVLVNESTANGQYTSGDYVAYADRMRSLFRAAGVEGNIRIEDFGEPFFVNYLTRQGVPTETAPQVVQDLLGTLRLIYRDLVHGGAPVVLEHHSVESAAAVREYLSRIVQPLAKPHLDTLVRFVQQHGAAMQQEAFQAIRTEAQGGVDAGLLLPVATPQLLQQCMSLAERHSTDHSMHLVRSWVLKQAEEQGVSFKAVMRLRHLLRDIFIDGVLPDQVIPLSITNAKDKLSIPLGRSADTGIVLDDRGSKSVEGVSPQHGTGVVTQSGEIVAIPFSHIRENPTRFRPIAVSFGGHDLGGYLALSDGAIVDLDGTLKPHDQELSDEVLAVVCSSLEAGIPFGFATGKGRESVQRHIRDPLIQYLERQGRDPNAACYQTLFIGGNNGAWASQGLTDVVFVDERRINLEALDRLPTDCTARELLASYVSALPSQPITRETFKPEDCDEFSLYLEPTPLRAVLERYGFHSSIEVIASLLNTDFEAHRIPLRAHANSGFIDIVDEHADKGRSVQLYHEHLEQVLGRSVNPVNIFRCGDSPAGNDMQLLRGGAARSVELTSQGPQAVARWLSLVLNLP